MGRRETSFGSAAVRGGSYQMQTPLGVDPRNSELWDRAMFAFGTAAVFQKRARRYRRLVTSLTFFGLVIPFALGLIVGPNLFKDEPLQRVVYFAGVLAGIQGLIFLWSVVSNWPERLEYSSAANADNLRLSNQLKALAVQSVNPPANFDVLYTDLVAVDNAQNAQDTRRDISPSETMYGYRAGLLQFQRTCKLCKEVPSSMKMPFWPWNRCPQCGGPVRKESQRNGPHENTIHP